MMRRSYQLGSFVQAGVEKEKNGRIAKAKGSVQVIKIR
jgi:hypothetical protein